MSPVSGMWARLGSGGFGDAADNSMAADDSGVTDCACGGCAVDVVAS